MPMIIRVRRSMQMEINAPVEVIDAISKGLLDARVQEEQYQPS